MASENSSLNNYTCVRFSRRAGAAFVCSLSSELVAAGIARRDFSPVPISPVVLMITREAVFIY
jgi:hypothetical protein